MTKKQTQSIWKDLRAIKKEMDALDAVKDEWSKQFSQLAGLLVEDCPVPRFAKVRITDKNGKKRVGVVTSITFGGIGRNIRHDVAWTLRVRLYRRDWRSSHRTLQENMNSLSIFSNSPLWKEGRIEVLDEPHPDEVKNELRRQRKFIGGEPIVFPDEVPPIPVPKGYVLLGMSPVHVPAKHGKDFYNLVVLEPGAKDWVSGSSGQGMGWVAAKKGTKIARLNLAAGKEESK